jgi:hypothetical protein
VPACLRACAPARLRACVSASRLLVCLPACVPAFRSAWRPTPLGAARACMTLGEKKCANDFKHCIACRQDDAPSVNNNALAARGCLPLLPLIAVRRAHADTASCAAARASRRLQQRRSSRASLTSPRRRRGDIDACGWSLTAPHKSTQAERWACCCVRVCVRVSVDIFLMGFLVLLLLLRTFWSEGLRWRSTRRRCLNAPARAHSGTYFATNKVDVGARRRRGGCTETDGASTYTCTYAVSAFQCCLHQCSEYPLFFPSSGK